MPMIQIDFEKFNKPGLKPILEKFNQAGLPVADVEATNKAKRESGFLVKSALITFESGQKLLVKAKAGGSIFQVKLNNKVLAIKNVDDIDKAVAEVLSFVKENDVRYQKAKDRAAAHVKVEVAKIKPVNTSVAEQLTALQTQIEEAGAKTETLRGEIAAKQTENAAKLATTTELQGKLAAEIERGNALQREYEALKEAA